MLRHRASLLIGDWPARALIVTLAAGVVLARLVLRTRTRRAGPGPAEPGSAEAEAGLREGKPRSM
jgi:hypothetical protein